MNSLRLITAAKLRYERGQVWISLVTNHSILLLVLKSFEKEINALGLTFLQAFLYGVVIYYSICYCIGFVDEKKGIWKKETVYNACRISPTTTETLIRLRRIENALRIQQDNNFVVVDIEEENSNFFKKASRKQEVES